RALRARARDPPRVGGRSPRPEASRGRRKPEPTRATQAVFVRWPSFPAGAIRAVDLLPSAGVGDIGLHARMAGTTRPAGDERRVPVGLYPMAVGGPGRPGHGSGFANLPSR